MDDSKMSGGPQVPAPFDPSYPSCPHCGRSIKKQRNQALDEAADIFVKKMEIHARQALWMGPQRQRYEGARISGVEMSPMNGPAISFDGALQHFLEIRALRSATED
jgi:hypothetical protein